MTEHMHICSNATTQESFSKSMNPVQIEIKDDEKHSDMNC